MEPMTMVAIGAGIGAAIGASTGGIQQSRINRAVMEAAGASVLQIKRSKVDKTSIRAEQSNQLIAAMTVAGSGAMGSANIGELIVQAQADGVIDVRAIQFEHNTRIKAVQANARGQTMPVWAQMLSMGAQGAGSGASIGAGLGGG